jgi:hypothetical protein
MVGVSSSSQPKWQGRPKRRGGRGAGVGQQQIRGAGERSQRLEHPRDLAKRQQPGHLRNAVGRRASADSTTCRSPAPRLPSARSRRIGRCDLSTATAARVTRPRSSNPTSMPAIRAGAPNRSRAGPALLESARFGRPQIPGARLDRPQREGRRSPASLMTRTVSDHRPSSSISAMLNQRAAAASLPGRTMGPGASATKSTRV